MKSLFKKIAYIMVIVTLTAQYIPAKQNILIDEAEAAGIRLSTSSYITSKSYAQSLGAPNEMEEVIGNNQVMSKSVKRIFPTAPSKTYNATDLPISLKDKATGKLYPGYCAQSYVYASKNMTVAGVVTDPRIFKLIDTVTSGAVENPSDAQQIAAQLVLWAALNNNFSPSMFSGGHMSSNEADYIDGYYVFQNVKRAMNNWADITSTAVKEIKPIRPKATTVAAKCTPVNSKDIEAVMEVEWEFVDGSAISNLSTIADMTYDGFNRVYRGADAATKNAIAKFGITPKANADYIILSAGKPSSYNSEINIKYKSHYEPLNRMTLFVYTGGSSNQPFLLPKKANTKAWLKATWNCPKDPEEIICEVCGVTITEPPPPPTPTSTAATKPIRWFNMPSVFGEIKNGQGANLLGSTTRGSYASTRDSEYFEAVNGVPSTERFYVNLGGTVGVIDVEYELVETSQDFVVTWSTPWKIEHKCTKPGPDGKPVEAVCLEEGTNHFDETKNIKFDALHFVGATVRTLGGGVISNPQLGIEIQVPNKTSISRSASLSPSSSGLQTGPGVGTHAYNIGATGSWATSITGLSTPPITGKQSTKEDGKSTAFSTADSQIGEVFAQNDALTITLNGQSYSFVPSVNKVSTRVFSGSNTNLSATNNQKQNYFNPIKERWNVWNKVPHIGYTGNPEAGVSRTIGTPLLVEDVPVNLEIKNGVYHFQDHESGNKVSYDSNVLTLKGARQGINNNISALSDGSGKGASTVYGGAKDPILPSSYNSGNFVNIQYTNWQVPISQGPGFNYNHSGKKPNGQLDGDQNVPAYRSLNPIVIQNPVSTQYAWISDIPDSQLKDQRIQSNSDLVIPYTQVKQQPRLYIDYDFQLSLPNIGSMSKYWGQTASNSTSAGLADASYVNGGILGKGFTGASANKITTPSFLNPYSASNPMDTSKWIKAKYVKFPFGVYYYKNSNEEGGDQKGFYAADTWIKLYDDTSVRSGDPTLFNFHITSDQKDIKGGLIYVVSEALNSPAELADDPEALFRASETYVNGTKSAKGTRLGAYNTSNNLEAGYSSSNVLTADVIGRMGNVAVSDVTDPAWTSVFWNLKNDKIDTTTPVSKNYGLNFNYYETLLNPNNSGYDGYDRFAQLKAWMGGSKNAHTLPLTTNYSTKGKEKQTAKLGYSLKGSIQTTGDYDYKIEVLPQHRLAGRFSTGTPATAFKLFTSSSDGQSTSYKEYYDSKVNNSNVTNFVYGKNYANQNVTPLSMSLADTRFKMSNWEKNSPGYQRAVQLGAQKKTSIGNSNMMTLGADVRTLIGSDVTQGKVGLSGTNANNTLGAKIFNGSADCPCSMENSQKWNFTYGLPDNSLIWFYENPANTTATRAPKFEQVNKDQYIITSMVFRTKTARTTYPGQGVQGQTSRIINPLGEVPYLAGAGQTIPDWDLAMYTNTGVNGAVDNLTSTKNIPDGLTHATVPNQQMTWSSTKGGSISQTAIDVIWWDYSKQAYTDKGTTGTH